MPLRDHFHPPLSKKKSWEGFHGAWPTVIVMALGRQLPQGYDAEPRAHLVVATDFPDQYEYAVCRFRRQGNRPRLETWAHAFALGQPLPTLPLWLADDLAVPLELNASYEETCRILRIG